MRKSPSSSSASLAAAAISASILASACVHSTVPEGQDPSKVAHAELDVAQDDWKHGRLRSAMAHAMRASEVDDSYAEAHHFVAILYLAVCQTEGDCRLDKAEKFARMAVVADPEHRPAKHTLGMILLAEKKVDEAIEVLRPLAEDILYKTPELAWYDLGGAYLAKNDTDHAIDALSKAIALKPTFCWADYRLGLAYEQKGLYVQAEKALSKSVTPNDPACKNLQDAYLARGRIYAKLGHRELARTDYHTCVDLSPSTDSGKSCQSSL